MIFKGVCRKDGVQLAKYLLSPKNEQVRVLDVRGTVLSENSPQGLKSALKDFDELGKMTRSGKTIFHLALNPNNSDRLSKEDWDYTVHKAEQALGLVGQPRAIVSHLYKGKEHLHVVWSRVDVDNAKCIHLSHSNLKLCQAAREVEIDLGLHKTPSRNLGMTKAKLFNEEIRAGKPSQKRINAEKHIENRAAKTKEERIRSVTSAWHTSKSGQEFKTMVEFFGLRIASGNRGFVLVDLEGEAHSIARLVDGIRQRDVRSKLRDLQDTPTVEDLREQRAKRPINRTASERTASDFWSKLHEGVGPQIRRSHDPGGRTL